MTPSFHCHRKMDECLRWRNGTFSVRASLRALLSPVFVSYCRPGKTKREEEKSPCTTMDPTKLPLSCLAEHLSPVCFLPPKSTWVTLSHYTPWCSWGHGVPVPSVSETFSPSFQDEIRHLLKETDIDVSPAPCFELWAMKCQKKVINGVICAFVSPPMLDCFWFESFTHDVCKIRHILLSPK